MAKAVKRAAPRQSEQGLRRWCIEQAMKWPQVQNVSGSVPGAQNTYLYQGQWPSYVDADIINRADRLLAWVKR